MACHIYHLPTLLTIWLTGIVGCLATTNNGCGSELRLAQNTTNGSLTTGLLQVKQDGFWYMVCNDPTTLDEHLVEVVCRQLGFLRYVPRVEPHPAGGQDMNFHPKEMTGNSFATYAQCEGTESCVSDCEGHDGGEDWMLVNVPSPTFENGVHPCYDNSPKVTVQCSSEPLPTTTTTTTTTTSTTSSATTTTTASTTAMSTSTTASTAKASTASAAIATTHSATSSSTTTPPTTTTTTTPTTTTTTTAKQTTTNEPDPPAKPFTPKAVKTSMQTPTKGTTTTTTTTTATTTVATPLKKEEAGKHGTNKTSTVAKDVVKTTPTAAAAGMDDIATELTNTTLNSSALGQQGSDKSEGQMRSILIGCLIAMVTLIIIIALAVVYKLKHRRGRSELKRRLYESGDNPAYMGTADYETISRDAQVLSAESSSVLAEGHLQDNVYLINGGKSPTSSHQGLTFSNPALAAYRNTSLSTREGYRPTGVQSAVDVTNENTPLPSSPMTKFGSDTPSTPNEPSFTFPEQGFQAVSQSAMLLKDETSHDIPEERSKSRSSDGGKKKRKKKRRKSKSSVQPLFDEDVCEELPVSVIPNSSQTGQLIDVDFKDVCTDDCDTKECTTGIVQPDSCTTSVQPDAESEHMLPDVVQGTDATIEETEAATCCEGQGQLENSMTSRTSLLNSNSFQVNKGLPFGTITVGMITPREFVCPITTKVMRNPVTAADGRTYERKALADWVAKHGTSPITGETLVLGDFTLDATLQARINEWRQRRRQQKQAMKQEAERSTGANLSGISC